MRNFGALFKVQFLSFLGGLGNSKKSKRPTNASKLPKLSAPLIFCAVIVFASYFYTKIFSELLTLTGTSYELIPLMLSVSVVVSLIFSFYSAVKVLFGFDDYDMLFSLPVKVHEVVISKLAFSYIVDFIFSLLIVLPSLIFSSKFNIELNAVNVVNLVVLLLGAPFFSIAISILIGFIIALVSARAKRKALIETLFFVCLLIGYFLIVILTTKNAQSAEDVLFLPLVKKTYFIYPLIVKGVEEIKYSLLALLIQLVAVVPIIAIVCAFYQKIHTLFVAKKTSRKFVLKTQKVKTTFKALYKKEIKRLFSSSLYVMNSLMGAVMALVGVIVLTIMLASADLSALSGLGEMLIVYAPAILSFTFFMAPPTNCSISLEGKHLWIIRSSPISMSKVFNAKILVSLTFYLPVGVVAGVLVPIALSVNFLTGLLFALLAITLPILSANVGLIMNLLFPLLNWDNESKAIKQGASVLTTMLSGFLITGLFGAGAYFIKIKAQLLILIMLLISLLLTVLSYLLIIKKGERILSKKA